MCEILAPCGSMEALHAALACGATGVYLGVGKLNARQNAQNFQPSDLQEVARKCHQRGVRCYLTLNTLLLPGEESEAEAILALADEACFDGIILQDLAVLRLIQTKFPRLPAHASTQLATTNAAGVKALRDLGFARVVLAREMSLAEIQKAAHLGVELEVFVHGALCASVSGQCYYSALAGGRSANRGMCAQPCRLDMRYAGDHTVLSLKDLCLADQIQTLADLGIASFKIEGRMKRPEYVAATTAAYLQALAGKSPDQTKLQHVFSRQGFTQGYYQGKIDLGQWGSRQKEDVLAASPALLADLRQTYQNPENRRDLVLVWGDFRCHGNGVSFCVTDALGNKGEATLPAPEAAVHQGITCERVTAQLQKTGDTPYLFSQIKAEVQGQYHLPLSALNQLRRQALDALTQARCAYMANSRVYGNSPTLGLEAHSAPPALCANHQSPCLVASFLKTPAPQALCGLGLAFVPAAAFHKDFATQVADLPNPPQMGLNLPGVTFCAELDGLLQLAKNNRVAWVLCHNLSQVVCVQQAGLLPFADATCNITNPLAAEYFSNLGALGLTLSFELKFRQLAFVADQVRLSKAASLTAAVCYGRLPLMQLRTCPRSIREGCKSCGGQGYTLQDRTGRVFWVACQGEVAELENADTLWLAHKMARFSHLDAWLLRFTTETAAEISQVVQAYKQAAQGQIVSPPAGLSHTTGLYERGLLLPTPQKQK